MIVCTHLVIYFFLKYLLIAFNVPITILGTDRPSPCPHGVHKLLRFEPGKIKIY
jgi:hypothetical protein